MHMYQVKSDFLLIIKYNITFREPDLLSITKTKDL